MRDIKIRIHSEAHSIAVQTRLFELGYRWNNGHKARHLDASFLFGNAKGGEIGRCNFIDKPYFESHAYTLVTLDDLYNEEKRVKPSPFEAAVRRAANAIPPKQSDMNEENLSPFKEAISKLCNARPLNKIDIDESIMEELKALNLAKASRPLNGTMESITIDGQVYQTKGLTSPVNGLPMSTDQQIEELTKKVDDLARRMDKIAHVFEGKFL